MAYLTRAHGDYRPVFNQDAASYDGKSFAINSATSASTVNLAGPKLEFFTIALANVATSGTVLNTAIQAIQQLATVAIYETTDTSTDTLAIAVYPAGAWTTTTLDTATGGTTSNGATFTN
jgi:hypothetical protein